MSQKLKCPKKVYVTITEMSNKKFKIERKKENKLRKCHKTEVSTKCNVKTVEISPKYHPKNVNKTEMSQKLKSDN